MQVEKIETKIYEIRGKKVMLDYDLAALYKVETKNLNLAVKRNIRRFPEDFMFKLSIEEWKSLRLQIETSKQRGGSRYLPHAFTEQGLAMLSGILNSQKAIEVNIAIMRTFVYLRQYSISHKELSDKLLVLVKRTNKRFKDIYQALNYLIQKDIQEQTQKDRKQVGYKTKTNKKP